MTIVNVNAGGHLTQMDEDVWLEVFKYGLSIKTGLDGYLCVILSNGPLRGKHLSRYILGILDSPEWIADHIDRNSLNNTRTNLRKVDNVISGRNRNGWGEIKYRGVSKNGKNYAAVIQVDGKKKHLGTYPSAELAFAARLRAETLYWSETE
jgi:hypothetical protein